MSEIQSFGASHRTLFTAALIGISISFVVTLKTHSAVTGLINKTHLVPHKYTLAINSTAIVLEAAFITGITTAVVFYASNFFFKHLAKKTQKEMQKEMQELVRDLNSKTVVDATLQYTAKDLLKYTHRQLYFFVQAMNTVQLTARFKEHICTQAFFKRLDELNIAHPKDVNPPAQENPTIDQPIDPIVQEGQAETHSPLIDWTPEKVKQYIPADATWQTMHKLNQATAIGNIIKLSEANIKALFETAIIPDGHRETHAAIMKEPTIRQKLGENVLLTWGPHSRFEPR